MRDPFDTVSVVVTAEIRAKDKKKATVKPPTETLVAIEFLVSHPVTTNEVQSSASPPNRMTPGKKA